MVMFFLIAAVMIAAALSCVVVPLLRHARDSAASDAGTRRLRALDEALSAGVIDAAEYAVKRSALAAATALPAAASAQPRSRVTFAVLLLVALLLPASALLLYRLVGAPQALDPANLVAAAAPQGEAQGPEMEKAIATLAQRLKDHPDDAEGWALLGRAYVAMSRPNDALDALKKAHELTPDNAALTVEYAQAIAVAAPSHRIEGAARDLLEGVVKSDPKNQRALWLLGISEYQANHFDAAIARWTTLLPLLPANSDVAGSVQKQIAEAQARRDGKAPPEPLAPNNETAGAAATTSSDATADSAANKPSAASLTVHVALDPVLKDKLDPSATLFVFARAASGPPMPLAIQRLKAGQLPLKVTLDDSMGMLPTMKLSMFPQVIVGARVSKSGNAMPQSGDLQTLSAPLDVHRSAAVELKIDSVVP